MRGAELSTRLSGRTALARSTVDPRSWFLWNFSFDRNEFASTFENCNSLRSANVEAQTLLGRACTGCHEIGKVNQARYSPDRWRVVAVDMRERGAKISDQELERLVEWLGRVKGTNPQQ